LTLRSVTQIISVVVNMSTSTPAYQTDPAMELKVWLLRRGLSQRSIARQLGVSVQYLNIIVQGKRKGSAIRKRLVTEFGIPAELVNYRPEEKAAA
jgi:transcriptional regulator with XRE-family HTH domain